MAIGGHIFRSGPGMVRKFWKKAITKKPRKQLARLLLRLEIKCPKGI